MKKFSVILTTLFSLVFTTVTMAGTSEVKWTDPDSYRDVDAGEGHRTKFKAKVFADLEEHFAKLAGALPEGQILLIDVKDVDLAGDVNQSMRRIRIVKDLYFPRIKFTYQVVDANKNEVSAGEINLKDMNFLMGSNTRYRQDLLSYEKRMLDDWFKETFVQ